MLCVFCLKKPKMQTETKVLKKDAVVCLNQLCVHLAQASGIHIPFLRHLRPGTPGYKGTWAVCVQVSHWQESLGLWSSLSPLPKDVKENKSEKMLTKSKLSLYKNNLINGKYNSKPHAPCVLAWATVTK